MRNPLVERTDVDFVLDEMLNIGELYSESPFQEFLRDVFSDKSLKSVNMNLVATS